MTDDEYRAILLRFADMPQDAQPIVVNSADLRALLAEVEWRGEMMRKLAESYYGALVSEYNYAENDVIGEACALLGIPPLWETDTDPYVAAERDLRAEYERQRQLRRQRMQDDGEVTP